MLLYSRSGLLCRVIRRQQSRVTGQQQWNTFHPNRRITTADQRARNHRGHGALARRLLRRRQGEIRIMHNV